MKRENLVLDKLLKTKSKALIVLAMSIILSIAYLGYKNYTYHNYSGEYIAIKGSNKVYHRDNCKYVSGVSPINYMMFSSAVEAVRLGYRQCTECIPPYVSKEYNDKILAQKKIEETKKRTEEENQRIEEDIRRKQVDAKRQQFMDELEERVRKEKDISNLKILGDSFESNYSTHTITCTVKNNDNIKHEIMIQSIYYDANNKPISSSESLNQSINSGETKGFTLNQFENANKIKRYELKIKPAHHGGFYGN